jgi:hypothetical protein
MYHYYPTIYSTRALALVFSREERIWEHSFLGIYTEDFLNFFVRPWHFARLYENQPDLPPNP